MSLMNLGQAVPASVVDLRDIASWCPACFSDGRPAASVQGLDAYLALLQQAYAASPEAVRQARALVGRDKRLVAGSAYLGTIVPESADLHNALAISLASAGSLDEAIAEFREALRLEPESAKTHWHLGAALASRGPGICAIRVRSPTPARWRSARETSASCACPRAIESLSASTQPSATLSPWSSRSE